MSESLFAVTAVLIDSLYSSGVPILRQPRDRPTYLSYGLISTVVSSLFKTVSALIRDKTKSCFKSGGNVVQAIASTYSTGVIFRLLDRVVGGKGWQIGLDYFFP